MAALESAVPISAGSVLLREDFQDGVADGWEGDGGWYTLTTDDRVIWAAADDAWAWYGEGADWSNYALRLAFRTEEGGLAVSVGVGAEGRYVVQIAPDGVFLLRDAPYGAFEPLASAAPVEPGGWHLLAVGYYGGHLQVYVDRVLLIDQRDPNPLGPGTVAVGALPGSYVGLDNVIVNELSGALPSLEPAAAAGDVPEGPLDPGPEVDPPEEVADGPDDPALANLDVTGVAFGRVEPGRPFTVSMTVANTGGVDAIGFAILWETDGADCATVATVRAGEAASVECESPGLAAGEYVWEAVADPGDFVEESDDGDNAASGRLTVGGDEEPEPTLPNLTPAWVAVSPEEPHTGDPITLQVGVAQVTPGVQGDLPAYTVRVFLDGVAVCSYDLYPGDEVAVCELAPILNPGHYRLLVEVDADDDVAEGTGEAGNTTELVVEVLPPGERRIDLRVTVGYSGEVGVGEPAEVSVRWSDTYDGGEVDDPFVVEVDVQGYGVLCTWLTTLVPGSEACVIPGWATPGEYRVVVTLDPGNTVIETNDDNNDMAVEITVE